MTKQALFLVFISLLGFLNVASVRKSEDPIRDTQTNPILYEQKKEEEKDGKKGPLMYHVKNNPREAFFIDPPFEAKSKTFAKDTVLDAAQLPADTTSWWEEQPTEPVVAPPVDETPPPSPEESFSGGEQSDELPDAEKDVASDAVAGTESENPPAGKGDDYWW